MGAPPPLTYVDPTGFQGEMVMPEEQILGFAGNLGKGSVTSADIVNSISTAQGGCTSGCSGGSQPDTGSGWGVGPPPSGYGASQAGSMTAIAMGPEPGGGGPQSMFAPGTSYTPPSQGGGNYAKGGGDKGESWRYSVPAPGLLPYTIVIGAANPYPGQTLPGFVQEELRPFFSRFGLDLSQIRVRVMPFTGKGAGDFGKHLGGTEIALNARWLEQAPAYGEILHTLVHEITHVVQEMLLGREAYQAFLALEERAWGPGRYNVTGGFSPARVGQISPVSGAASLEGLAEVFEAAARRSFPVY